ncbi:MAG: hypothetical protein JRF52_01745 [Deltaproteobacteria bacterium]|nr:hypothetical protein [Deltaproteobacteria bacterium]
MKRICGVITIFVGMFFLFSVAWAADDWESITAPVKVFEEGYIQVTGASEEGQSRYKAMRAATVIAQRDLLEVLEGIRLYGETTVKDGMLRSDDIRTTIQGFLRGGVKCGDKFHSDRGYAEVCMRLYIRGKGGLYDVILPLIKENKLNPEQRPYYKPKLIPKVLSETPTPTKKADVAVPLKVKDATPVPEARPEVVKPSEITVVYDGIIIDVRDFQFKPALVNTILTDKDEIVFDPSKILSSVLVERGCGGFTTDPGKAKALLASWGSTKPMMLKGIAVVKMTNAKVSVDDAAAIYVHDKKSNLLAQAKVVFLLK